MAVRTIQLRLLGAGIGAGTSAVVMAVGFMTGGAYVELVAFIGIPFGAVAGFARAPGVVLGGNPWRAAVETTLIAIGLWLILFGVGLTLSMTLGGPEPPNAGSIPRILFGIGIVTLYSFMFALPVALPVAYVSAAILLRLVTRSPVIRRYLLR